MALPAVGERVDDVTLLAQPPLQERAKGIVVLND